MMSFDIKLLVRIATWVLFSLLHVSNVALGASSTEIAETNWSNVNIPTHFTIPMQQSTQIQAQHGVTTTAGLSPDSATSRLASEHSHHVGVGTNGQPESTWADFALHPMYVPAMHAAAPLILPSVAPLVVPGSQGAPYNMPYHTFPGAHGSSLPAHQQHAPAHPYQLFWGPHLISYAHVQLPHEVRPQTTLSHKEPVQAFEAGQNIPVRISSLSPRPHASVVSPARLEALRSAHEHAEAGDIPLRPSRRKRRKLVRPNDKTIHCAPQRPPAEQLPPSVSEARAGSGGAKRKEVVGSLSSESTDSATNSDLDDAEKTTADIAFARATPQELILATKADMEQKLAKQQNDSRGRAQIMRWSAARIRRIKKLAKYRRQLDQGTDDVGEQPSPQRLQGANTLKEASRQHSLVREKFRRLRHFRHYVAKGQQPPLGYDLTYGFEGKPTSAWLRWQAPLNYPESQILADMRTKKAKSKDNYVSHKPSRGPQKSTKKLGETSKEPWTESATPTRDAVPSEQLPEKPGPPTDANDII